MRKFIIMGIQGSGKGTQAKLLADDLDLEHLSVGDIFRWNVQHHTKLGAQVKRIMASGYLVGDDLVESVVRDRLSAHDWNFGFIIDGFPRNPRQGPLRRHRPQCPRSRPARTPRRSRDVVRTGPPARTGRRAARRSHQNLSKSARHRPVVGRRPGRSGYRLFQRARLARGQRYYRDALTADPEYALAHFNLGNLFDEMGDRAKALHHYQTALRLNSNYADAHYNIALLYQCVNQPLKAVRHWKAYLKLDPAAPGRPSPNASWANCAIPPSSPAQRTIHKAVVRR